MRSRRQLVSAGAIALVAILVDACGADVDLGGTTDGGTLEASVDAGALGATECEPCQTAADCAESELCGQVGGDPFCLTRCTSSATCPANEVCGPVTSAAGDRVTACVPTTGTCAPAAGPTMGDAALERCGTLDGPNIVSTCHACGKSSDDCQPNGCYGGYWCSSSAKDCRKPPKTCP